MVYSVSLPGTHFKTGTISHILVCKIFKNKELESRKVLLNGFHLNGHTLGFHPQTQKLEPPCTA